MTIGICGNATRYCYVHRELHCVTAGVRVAISRKCSCTKETRLRRIKVSITAHQYVQENKVQKPRRNVHVIAECENCLEEIKETTLLTSLIQ